MRAASVVMLAALATASAQNSDRLTLPGNDGPGKGKRIVLISGDEEYRSEQVMPQLAAILSRHGFDCTVLFAIDPSDGTIDPRRNDNIPGLEMLDRADLMVIFTRFRDLPDAQMKHIVDYVESGKPIIGIRTATHAFDLKKNPTFNRYSWNSKEWDGGFGRQILGETWIDHHGRHAEQSTRGIIAPGQEKHPIVRGIASGEIWAPTDVYAVRLPLPADAMTLVLGAVLQGMKPDDPPVLGKVNDPMMPVAWTRTRTIAGKAAGRVFTTTMGSAQDLTNEAFRRLLVNACYWSLNLENRLPAKANVDLQGEYNPLPFRFGGAAKGLRPADLRPR